MFAMKSSKENFLEGNFWVTEIPCRFKIHTKGHYGTGWLVHKKLCSWRRAFAAATAATSSAPCTPPRRAIAAKSGCYFQENCALANGEGLNGVLRVMKTTTLWAGSSAWGPSINYVVSKSAIFDPLPLLFVFLISKMGNYWPPSPLETTWFMAGP